jgi:hypothetical protein
MTKFVLGVAVGYIFSDIIDDLISKATSTASKLDTPPVPETPVATAEPA